MGDKDKVELLDIFAILIKAAKDDILPAVLQIMGDFAKSDPSLEDIEDLKNRLPGDGNEYFL